MPRKSAGLLLFRRRDRLEVLLVHPEGPLWAKKDEGTPMRQASGGYAQLDAPSQALRMALWYFSKTRFATLARCIDTGPPWSAAIAKWSASSTTRSASGADQSRRQLVYFQNWVAELRTRASAP